MKIRVLFFGATADLAGERAIDLHLADSATVSDVVSTITDRNNDFSNPHLLVAVNEEYVPLDTKIKDGDELAIFTAVSGG